MKTAKDPYKTLKIPTNPQTAHLTTKNDQKSPKNSPRIPQESLKNPSASTNNPLNPKKSMKTPKNPHKTLKIPTNPPTSHLTLKKVQNPQRTPQKIPQESPENLQNIPKIHGHPSTTHRTLQHP